MRSLFVYIALLAVVTVFSIAMAEPLRPKSFLAWLLAVPVLVACYLAAEALSDRLPFLAAGAGGSVLSWRRVAVGLALFVPFLAVPAIAVWFVRSFS